MQYIETDIITAGDEPPPYGYIYHIISNIQIYMRYHKRTTNGRPYDQRLARCISSSRRLVYHQRIALYIIKALPCISPPLRFTTLAERGLHPIYRTSSHGDFIRLDGFHCGALRRLSPIQFIQRKRGSVAATRTVSLPLIMVKF